MGLPGNGAKRSSEIGHRIESARFILRTLTPEDATSRYLGWFSDPSVGRYIAAARQRQSIATLRAFIAQKLASPSAELLGIFLRHGGAHVGNIKFEPIQDETRAAVVGVMIGDVAWRGKGTFGEAFLAASTFLRVNRGIREFWLGVEQDHESALAGYRKAGFLPGSPPPTLIPETREDCIYLVCRRE